MKVRHLKARALAAHLSMIWSDAYWQRKIDEMLAPTPEDIARNKAEREAFWEKLKASLPQFKEEEVEAAKVEYVVAKVSNDEVVGSFDLHEDAVALINKHHKQKKARLYLLGDHVPEHCTEFDAA
jgi:hypothetical protein